VAVSRPQAVGPLFSSGGGFVVLSVAPPGHGVVRVAFWRTRVL
jgi:hypothetical protein